MKKTLKHTTYEDAVQHGDNLLEELGQNEEYAAAVARAEEMGITISASIRHTYTDEFEAGYTPAEEPTGQLPSGYAMELWFDLTHDGHVLVAKGENPVQCSVGATAIEFSVVFLTARLNFFDLDYILEHNPIAAMLEEFLDLIEENGAAPSPFVADGLCSPTPGGSAAILSRQQVLQGAFVEFSSNPYDGTFGAEDSLFIDAEVALPYRLFLHAAMNSLEAFQGDHLALNADQTEAFAAMLEEVPDTLESSVNFATLYNALCGFPLEAPPRAERLLDALTILRETRFTDDCTRLAAFIRDAQANDKQLTVIW